MKTSTGEGNVLLLAARELFAALARFVSATPKESIHEQVVLEFKPLFMQCKQQLIEYEVNEFVQQHALYALASLVDECVMYSSWDGRHGWVSQSLQLMHFQDNQAGEHFFEKLQQFCHNPLRYRELIEFYYVCLKLGFAGQYRERNKELQALTEQLYQQIKWLYQEEGVAIPQTNVTAVSNNPMLSKKWKMGMLISVFLMACQYMGYSMALSTDYHKLKHVWSQHKKLYPYHKEPPRS